MRAPRRDLLQYGRHFGLFLFLLSFLRLLLLTLLLLLLLPLLLLVLMQEASVLQADWRQLLHGSKSVVKADRPSWAIEDGGIADKKYTHVYHYARSWAWLM